jgi:hypothetical protein
MYFKVKIVIAQIVIIPIIDNKIFIISSMLFNFLSDESRPKYNTNKLH